MLYILLKYTLGLIVLLIMRPMVYGRQNLDVKGKAIFVCNHRSMFDPVLIALVTKRPVHFMAKKEIFKSWAGKLFFKGLFAFPVDRKNVDLFSLKQALDVLNKGKIFGIFPEGKRAVTDELDEFEKGAAFLAIRSGAPVIPLYISPESYRRLRPMIMVGRPIDINGIVASANKSALIDVVSDEIADAINALKGELEDTL